MVFLSQNIDGNMIFTDYWKALVSTFPEMGNTIFSRAKKLTEIWCLLITGKFLFWTFRWLKIRSFFWVRKLMERWYLLVTERFLFWTFQWWEIRYFFSQKVDKRWYLRGLFELSMILQDLGNMVFRAVVNVVQYWWNIVTKLKCLWRGMTICYIINWYLVMSLRGGKVNVMQYWWNIVAKLKVNKWSLSKLLSI